MTNMCVLFTAQGAFLNGYQPTVVADASATRPLPLKGDTGGIPAEQLHQAALATVQDLVRSRGAVAEVADLTIRPDTPAVCRPAAAHGRCGPAHGRPHHDTPPPAHDAHPTSTTTHTPPAHDTHPSRSPAHLALSPHTPRSSPTPGSPALRLPRPPGLRRPPDFPHACPPTPNSPTPLPHPDPHIFPPTPHHTDHSHGKTGHGNS